MQEASPTRNQPTDGLNKCPHCGSTDIAIQPGTGKLQCHYCHSVFEPALLNITGFKDIGALSGDLISSGATDITQPDLTQVTIKCQGCGAEVVVNVDEAMYARCHWCRQLLTIKNQMPNGAVPDVVLPFQLSRQDAQARIEEFVKERRFFAKSRFKREFTTENIIGVYLPYLVVDLNAHGDLRGDGGTVRRKYRINKTTYYDIDIFEVGRDFDLLVDNLTLEGKSERRNVNAHNNTNNVINSIMPFDLKHAVPYNGNYLKGFNSERRDTNIDELKRLAGAQLRDIARYQANTLGQKYDAGVHWRREDVQVKGTRWLAAYLPVWLYSYYEVKSGGRDGGQNLLHYVAVNAQTGETMGSVPISRGRLFVLAAFLELIAAAICIGVIILWLSS